ncbi:MAG: GNAT family N-acetyltransferase [Phycisphaeraceae bacterium]|nr:GNAT family N-acetyltransferase [Phycisphaeraceae bacterium]
MTMHNPRKSVSTTTTSGTHPAPVTPRRLLARIAPERAVEVVAPCGVTAGRMVLRALAESDRESFLATINGSRAHLEPWIPLNNPGESDDAFFERQLQLASTGDSQGTAWRRIGVLPSGEIVGGFNLNAIARGLQSSADMNWWIASGHTRQGLAREGIVSTLRHAFADLPAGLGLHTIHAGIAPENRASIRLALSLGFSHDRGVQSYLRVGERWELHDIYAVTVLEAHALAG